MNFLKKIPIPICGVALGFAALGNLLQSYSVAVRYCFGGISAILLFAIMLKLICYFKTMQDELGNAVNFSVAMTAPMALLLLSVYIKPFFATGAYALWLFALVLHCVGIIVFTIKFIFKLDMKTVFASYYIVYVGIAVASVTAPAFQKLLWGEIIFWFAFVSFIALFILVTYRYTRFKEMPEPAKPLICIYAAPMSLLLAGYIQSVAQKNAFMITAMLIVSLAIYIAATVMAIRFIIKHKFFTSFASFTFPFVISAIATKQTAKILAGNIATILEPLAMTQIIIAIVLCIFVLVKYIVFMLTPQKKA